MSTSFRDHGLGGWLARRASFSPEATALVHEERRWTYAELQRDVETLAGILASGGVRRGDRVAFLDLNHPDYLLTLFATARLGAIFLPLNFRLTAPELRFILDDAGAHTLLYGPDHEAVVAEIRDQLPCRVVERSGAVTAVAANAAPEHDVDADDVALIMYTSGTTGLPKGAMITHANLLASIQGFSLTFETRATDRTLVVAPLFHIGGLNVTTLSALLAGATVVLERRFDADRILGLLERHRITTMFAVPTMLLELERSPRFTATDLDALRLIVSGGAPVPAEVVRRYLERDIDVCVGYGMTEAAPLITLVPPGRVADKLGSVGLPSFFTEVRLVDDAGRDVAVGERGEFVIRGPNVMKGYWNRPDATAEAFEGGWFHTGDIGVQDADGFYAVVDRKKDMIITGGENVYPAEVEACLLAHEAVLDAAVFGVPDEHWGEAVAAVVVPVEEGAIDEAGVMAHVASQLARYKQPRLVIITKDLPRSPSGKVVKGELRERYAGATVRPVGRT